MRTAIKIYIATILVITTSFGARAQSTKITELKSISPFQVQITTEKTTNIVFPFEIIGVDRGSKDVLAQKAKGASNILQVKAASDTIRETNLSVVTSDGKLNSFILSYSPQPYMLNYVVGASSNSGKIQLAEGDTNQEEIENYARFAATSKKNSRAIKDSSFGIKLGLDGIFINGNMMYFRLAVANTSNIGYDVDQFRFYIRDQKKAKRTASQEIEAIPVLVYGNVGTITAAVPNVIVVALPKFTIPDKKYLAVQLMEKNGGRHFELKVKNKDVINAFILPKL